MMARALRIEYPRAHYHVMSRGNERRPIVRRRRQAKRFDDDIIPEMGGIHATCLSSNEGRR